LRKSRRPSAGPSALATGRELDGQMLGALLACQGDQPGSPPAERKMSMPFRSCSSRQDIKTLPSVSANSPREPWHGQKKESLASPWLGGTRFYRFA